MCYCSAVWCVCLLQEIPKRWCVCFISGLVLLYLLFLDSREKRQTLTMQHPLHSDGGACVVCELKEPQRQRGRCSTSLLCLQVMGEPVIKNTQHLTFKFNTVFNRLAKKTFLIPLLCKCERRRRRLKCKAVSNAFRASRGLCSGCLNCESRTLVSRCDCNIIRFWHVISETNRAHTNNGNLCTSFLQK